MGRCARAAFEMRAGGVRRDLIQPGSIIGSSIQAGISAISAQESFLQAIFGIGCLPQQAPQVSEDLRTMRLHQCFKVWPGLHAGFRRPLCYLTTQEGFCEMGAEVRSQKPEFRRGVMR